MESRITERNGVRNDFKDDSFTPNTGLFAIELLLSGRTQHGISRNRRRGVVQ